MNELAIRDESQYLATVRDVRDLAERIERVEDAKDLADRAAAARVWAERARLGQDQVNLASGAKLWAERRAGELLRETVRHEGGRPAKESQRATVLPEGVSKSQSSRWQHLAAIPADTFQDAVEEASDQGAVTAASVTRIAERKLERRVREEFFPVPTPVFDAFWKACTCLMQRARPDQADGEEWDTETRRRVREWAPLMVERIDELAALADDNGLHVIQGGASGCC